MTAELPKVHQLADLLDRPELLRPPPVILPRFAWEGRASLLAAPEKGGKSTLIGQGVAAGARGDPFLGEAMPETPALWFALDEPLGDLVRRLARFGARHHVAVCQERVSVPDLVFLIEQTGAKLVIIDTLIEFFADVVEAKEIYNPMAWQPVLSHLRAALQATGAAAVLLHHTTRDGQRYADSRQLGAGVDTILTMQEDAADRAVRKVDGRGRVLMERFRVRYGPGGYQLDEGELPLELRVYQAIEREPGVSGNRLREMVGGRRDEVRAAVARLLNQQQIRDEVKGRGHGYVATAAGREMMGQSGPNALRGEKLSDSGKDPTLFDPEKEARGNGVTHYGAKPGQVGSIGGSSGPDPTPSHVVREGWSGSGGPGEAGPGLESGVPIAVEDSQPIDDLDDQGEGFETRGRSDLEADG